MPQKEGPVNYLTTSCTFLSLMITQKDQNM